MSRRNFTGEDATLTRDMVQALINDKPQGQAKANGKDKVKLKNILKGLGHDDDSVDKTLDDLNSYADPGV